MTRLLDYGAEVAVVSPQITGPMRALVEGDRIAWIQREYQQGDLEGAFIAIVADTSDPEINLAASREATMRNVPLNVVDVTNLCSWIAPAIARRGDVVVAASTGGASPALARRLRDELSGTSRQRSQHPVMDYADLAPMLSDARKELARNGVKLASDHWQACLTDDLIELVQAGRSDEAKEALMSRLLIGADCDCRDGVCKLWEDLDQASKV